MLPLTSLLCTEGSGEVCIPISSLPPESGGAYFTVYSLWGIIDVVRADEFFQDEIGIRTSPDLSVRNKLVRGVLCQTSLLTSLAEPDPLPTFTNYAGREWSGTHQ